MQCSAGKAMAEHINGRLYWEQMGKSGLPVVFVHSSPLDHSCWLYQMDHFSTWYRCISVDLPGYGKSATAQRGLTIADLAVACWESLDEVTADPAILVGESVGWHVVMHMANQRPERTLAILMSGCAYRTTNPPTHGSDNLSAFREQGMEARYERILGLYAPSFRDTDLARYFGQNLTERNPWGDAASIVEVLTALGPYPRDPEWLFEGSKPPTLIVTGSEDGAHEGAFALQQRISGCELVTIEGAGHACNMERPWEWDTHALRFLGRCGLFAGDIPDSMARTG
jgi:pimeloyl-ACP methyl ester carboxylesterase